MHVGASRSSSAWNIIGNNKEGKLKKLATLSAKTSLMLEVHKAGLRREGHNYYYLGALDVSMSHVAFKKA